MDRYRSLHKENPSTLSPRRYNQMNRDIRNANRAKQRERTFQNGRNFEVSPTPIKNRVPLEKSQISIEVDPQLTINKENNATTALEKLDKLGTIDVPSINKSRIAMAVSAIKKNEKLSRQDAFIKRFVEFKAKKQMESQMKLESKYRPFIPVGGKTFNPPKLRKKESSFVPSGHTKFHPPKGLKNPLLESNGVSGERVKVRKSFYAPVPTPPKKENIKVQTSSKLVNALPGSLKTPAVSKNLPAGNVRCGTDRKVIATSNNKKPSTIVTRLNKVDPNIVINRVLTYPTTDTKDGAESCSKLPQKNEKSVLRTLRNATTTNDQPAKQRSTSFVKPDVPLALKPRIRKVTRSSKSVKGGLNTVSTKSGGAVGKAYQIQNKCGVGTSCSSSQKNAKLSVKMKPKKSNFNKFASSSTISVAIKQTVTSAKAVASSKLVCGGTEIDVDVTAFPIAETPTDVLNSNHFDPFVTSTKMKSLSPRHVKQLIQAPEKSTQGLESITGCMQNAASSVIRSLLQTKQQGKERNFNFVRYSMGQTEQNLCSAQENNECVVRAVEKDNENQYEAHDSSATIQETVVEQKQQSQSDNVSLTLLHSNQDAKILKTPPSTKLQDHTDRPSNYLSPYVSVSRGKVSAKKEREQRNSVYLQNTPPILKLSANEDKLINTPTDVEIRRTIEAVRYFRLQLASEIERLHSLCAKWETYKVEQLPLLQNTGGEDMINVTIGQTKLLTSKKFQQFSGLIDRCEAGAFSNAMGKVPEDDGTEKTKLITSTDLEGFWSMLNLQVDNVEKRFDNLERWKANNWIDPAEIDFKPKPKAKNNLHKVKKPKPMSKTAKPTSGLQEMLRKMHAEMRKNKAEAAVITTTSISNGALSTPTQQRRSKSGTPVLNKSGSSQRVSVMVRDRKSLSIAATVLSIPATNAAVAAAVAAQRRSSRTSLTPKKTSCESCESSDPKQLVTSIKQFRRSIQEMEETTSRRTELLRTAALNSIHSSQKKKGYNSMDVMAKSPPSSTKILGRPSILKTPGTSKGKPKNVNFSARLRVKKFNFTRNDNQSEDEETEEKMKDSMDDSGKIVTAPQEFHNLEEDPDQRTYQLRTRKVLLRPSSEFEIPRA